MDFMVYLSARVVLYVEADNEGEAADMATARLEEVLLPLDGGDVDVDSVEET